MKSRRTATFLHHQFMKTVFENTMKKWRPFSLTMRGGGGGGNRQVHTDTFIYIIFYHYIATVLVLNKTLWSHVDVTSFNTCFTDIVTTNEVSIFNIINRSVSTLTWTKRKRFKERFLKEHQI